MISADALNEAIREGKISVTEQRRLLEVLAQIAVRLWHEVPAEQAQVPVPEPKPEPEHAPRWSRRPAGKEGK